MQHAQHVIMTLMFQPLAKNHSRAEICLLDVTVPGKILQGTVSQDRPVKRPRACPRGGAMEQTWKFTLPPG